MAHHFTKNTEEATRWCNHCARATQHSVSAGRIGRCLEHNAEKLSQKQRKRQEAAERARQNPRLF